MILIRRDVRGLHLKRTQPTPQIRNESLNIYMQISIPNASVSLTFQHTENNPNRLEKRFNLLENI